MSYEAKGAVVAGLAFAAQRDIASAVKHQQAGPISARYAYAFGASQDGRFLRQFLYEGFNADEHDQRAFDGVIAHIAGSARGGDFNSRFARPNGLGFFVASLFPYLDLDQKDPLTGKTDGIQMKLKPEQRPKIFYTNSSGEYWGGGRAAALTHTTLDGGTRTSRITRDLSVLRHPACSWRLPAVARPGPAEAERQRVRLRAARSARRARSMGSRRGGAAAERASAVGRTNAGAARPDRFPGDPGRVFAALHPRRLPRRHRRAAQPLPLLVPQVDGDGNELSGIRLPNIVVPLATYTGWNFRNASIGQPGELLPLTGSFIPLPVTKAARDAAHDPRRSIEERYESRERYQALAGDAAAKLVQQRYLLSEDIPTVVERALATWDTTTRSTASARQSDLMSSTTT